MESTLSELKFDITVYHDRLEKEIKQILKNISRENHSQNDCLAIFVLSHGSHDKIYAYDKEYSIKTLLQNFLGENCPSLSGKPKLFFLQACRGEILDKGFIYNTDIDNDILGQTNGISYYVPSTLDILIMYATFQCHVSWRNTITGTWFVQSLCKGLNKYARDNDLVTILTAVCNLVAYGKNTNITDDKNVIHKFKQMPSIESTLTKLVFFEEKNCENRPIIRFEKSKREPLQLDEDVTHTMFKLSASKTSYEQLQYFLFANFGNKDCSYKLDPIKIHWLKAFWTSMRSYDLIIPNDFVYKFIHDTVWPKDVVLVANIQQEN